jgi:hypothetical protein
MNPWGRRARRLADAPVGAVVLGARWYLIHPDVGVLEVRGGRTSDGVPIFATVAEPRRWFAMSRGLETPEGLYAEILWEVDPDVGQRALDRRAGGDTRAADVVAAHLDVRILREAASL